MERGVTIVLYYGNGKYEPAGLRGSPMHQTGVALARLGYVVLCPDALGFGDFLVALLLGSVVGGAAFAVAMMKK